MEVSFEINTDKGDALVVSLISSYDYLRELIDQSRIGNLEVIDVSIVRKSGHGRIPITVLKEVASKISDIMESSPNAILYYFCDSTDPIPTIRQYRELLCQEYRDRLFNLMFVRYGNIGSIEWQDYRIKTTINDQPQFVHLIYRPSHKDTIVDIETEIRKVFSEIELQK